MDREHLTERIWWQWWRNRCWCGQVHVPEVYVEDLDPPRRPIPDGTPSTDAVLRMGRPAWATEPTDERPRV